VFDTVLLGRWSRFGGFGAAKPVDIHDAQHAIEAVGLTGFERRPIDTLSVGQFQRVLFARLLLQDADLVLLDEPFAAIDAKTVADLMMLIQRWRTEKRTVVCVLHDLDQVRREFPNSLLLARELVLAVMVLILRRHGYPPPQVNFLGKAATFNLMYAFPLLLLSDGSGWISSLAAIFGWAFAGWGTTLYWWAGVLYVVQVRRLVRADATAD